LVSFPRCGSGFHTLGLRVSSMVPSCSRPVPCRPDQNLRTFLFRIALRMRLEFSLLSGFWPRAHVENSHRALNLLLPGFYRRFPPCGGKTPRSP
jgi:hypothetical protein